LDELALHHRHRAGIVDYGTRTDQSEDVVLAGLLHRVGLIEDLRVVVLEYQPAPVDPAQAVAELNEGLDRAVDTGGWNRDHPGLVGDDTDGDARVGDPLLSGTTGRLVLPAPGFERPHRRRLYRRGAALGSRNARRGDLEAGRSAALARPAGRGEQRHDQDERSCTTPHHCTLVP